MYECMRLYRYSTHDGDVCVIKRSFHSSAVLLELGGCTHLAVRRRWCCCRYNIVVLWLLEGRILLGTGVVAAREALLMIPEANSPASSFDQITHRNAEWALTFTARVPNIFTFDRALFTDPVRGHGRVTRNELGIEKGTAILVKKLLGLGGGELLN